MESHKPLTNKHAATRSSFAKVISTDELNSTLTSLQLLTKLYVLTEQYRTTYLFIKDFCNTKNIQSAPPIPPMTIAEVFNALVHLQRTGARGLDGLDGKILKLSALVICDTPTYIYNLCIEKCSIPVAFKQTEVIPLCISRNCSDPSNYMPISILSVISKHYKDT